MTDYRGWHIEPAYIGWHATHPDFDVEMDDGQWVGNGLKVHAMTLEGVKVEVDCWIEEHLPDGLRSHEGQIQFQCRVCEHWTGWLDHVADYDPDAHENMCGGSPQCCP